MPISRDQRVAPCCNVATRSAVAPRNYVMRCLFWHVLIYHAIVQVNSSVCNQTLLILQKLFTGKTTDRHMNKTDLLMFCCIVDHEVVSDDHLPVVHGITSTYIQH